MELNPLMGDTLWETNKECQLLFSVCSIFCKSQNNENHLTFIQYLLIKVFGIIPALIYIL